MDFRLRLLRLLPRNLVAFNNIDIDATGFFVSPYFIPIYLNKACVCLLEFFVVILDIVISTSYKNGYLFY